MGASSGVARAPQLCSGIRNHNRDFLLVQRYIHRKRPPRPQPRAPSSSHSQARRRAVSGHRAVPRRALPPPSKQQTRTLPCRSSGFHQRARPPKPLMPSDKCHRCAAKLDGQPLRLMTMPLPPELIVHGKSKDGLGRFCGSCERRCRDHWQRLRERAESAGPMRRSTTVQLPPGHLEALDRSRLTSRGPRRLFWI